MKSLGETPLFIYLFQGSLFVDVDVHKKCPVPWIACVLIRAGGMRVSEQRLTVHVFYFIIISVVCIGYYKIIQIRIILK